MLFQVPTLEYLRRGGRIGKAQSMVGDVFGIRPLIAIDDGELVAYAKVRGERRALEAMSQPCSASAARPTTPSSSSPGAPTPTTSCRPSRRRCSRCGRKAEVVFHGRVGAIVGTHGGPGMFAFAMIVE